jgi:aldose 1-epimerase
MATHSRGTHTVEVLQVGDSLAEIVVSSGAALGRLCLAGREVASAWLERDPYNERYRGALLAPWPNRVQGATYDFAGKNYQLAVTEPQLGHALHGLLARVPFAVVARHSESDVCRLVVEHHYLGTHPGFPFAFRVHATWVLTVAGLELRVEATNTGSQSMPFGVGWHPYFSLGGSVGDLHLRVPARAEYATDAAMIPTGQRYADPEVARGAAIGERQFDTLYALQTMQGTAQTRLWDPRTGDGIELWQTTGPGGLNYLCAFVPPDRQSIALEPMSCAIDSFHSGDGLAVLAPGASFAATMGVCRLVRGAP